MGPLQGHLPGWRQGVRGEAAFLPASGQPDGAPQAGRGRAPLDQLRLARTLANPQAPLPKGYVDALTAARAALKKPVGVRFLLGSLKQRQTEILMFETWRDWVQLYGRSSLRDAGFPERALKAEGPDACAAEHSAIRAELEACPASGPAKKSRVSSRESRCAPVKGPRRGV